MGYKKTDPRDWAQSFVVDGMVFGAAFAGVCRLIDLTILNHTAEPRATNVSVIERSATGRSNIIDRNGMILVVNLPTVSLSADPLK